MTRITDERLAALSEGWEHEAAIGAASRRSDEYADMCRQTVEALRELQAARELLTTLAAQWSGEIGSTKRSDCMAVLARAHLRNYGQAHD